MNATKQKIRPMEWIMNAVFFICGFVAIVFVLFISIYLIISGLPAIREIGLVDFLFGREWASTASDPKFGILPFILTSIYGTCGAIILLAHVDTPLAVGMMAGAFTGGNGDYVTLFEPTATEVELAGKGYILTSIGTESGEIPYTAFFASKNYIKENPETIQSFTNAIAKGLEWIAESDSAKVAQVLSPQFPDTDLDILAKVIERHIEIDAWNNELIMKEDSLERLETVMEQAGELDERADYDILVDNSFAEKALAGK